MYNIHVHTLFFKDVLVEFAAWTVGAESTQIVLAQHPPGVSVPTTRTCMDIMCIHIHTVMLNLCSIQGVA